MTKLMREPLVHFVLLGIALFMGHGLWERWVTKTEYTIVIPKAEIQRQAAIFAAENKRQPTNADIDGLLFAHAEEKILMREARRLGLEDDDTIIRRRLAQKMRFMLNEDTPPALPPEKELREWFENNREKFVWPAQRRFVHIYFSPGEHDDVEAAAREALAIVNDENWREIGDPFIEQVEFPLIDQTSLARKMGYNFANSLFELPPKPVWQGPIESSFGLHLVKIEGRTNRSVPSFEQAREEIAEVWQEETLRENNQKRLTDLLNEYEVVVPEGE
ncbi:MAG: hypothetical protein HKN36_05865 [Hellea sp.]|nr:hypothetical protein [Hellea sp.]